MNEKIQTSKIYFDSVIVGLTLILAVGFIISFMLGKYPIAPAELFSILASNVLPIDQTWTDQQAVILYHVRMPRIILSVLVGCCLSAAGAAYQGIFRNPLVSSDIVGASSGAAFGAALAILMAIGNLGISILAFVFSIGAVMAVGFLSKKVKTNPVLGLVLAGIMVGSLFNSATSFLKLVADPNEQLPAITYWLMGSFSGAKLEDIRLAIIPMAAGLIPLFLLRWKINILTMVDDEARTMGVDTKKTRAIIVIAATLVTAASIAVSGMIGWIGLVIPHLSRMLVGSDYRRLMPVSMLMGASFLLIVDNVSRLTTTSEIPIGILTSFIGAPFFFYLISREGEKF